MKHIGFLSFGHWTPSPQSQTRTASDALLQSIELAVAAEDLGADGAYFRVHHFARQLGSPFPLLAACGARTSRIAIGTAVIDMRYENPMYMAEDAGAADLIAGGRLQLGISRGSPEQVIDGFRYFGYVPAEGITDADMARRHTEVFLELLLGKGFAKPHPNPMFPNPSGLLRLEPYSEGLRERIWWGAGTNATAHGAVAAPLATLLETMNTVPMSLGISGYGVAVLSRTVSGSTMIFSVIWFVYSVKGDGLFGTCAVRSIENTTSAAVKSEPSWNLTPLRSLNSQVRSSIAFHDTASAGFNSDFGSFVMSVSKMCSAILLFGVRL